MLRQMPVLRLALRWNRKTEERSFDHSVPSSLFFFFPPLVPSKRAAMRAEERKRVEISYPWKWQLDIANTHTGGTRRLGVSDQKDVQRKRQRQKKKTAIKEEEEEERKRVDARGDSAAASLRNSFWLCVKREREFWRASDSARSLVIFLLSLFFSVGTPPSSGSYTTKKESPAGWFGPADIESSPWWSWSDPSSPSQASRNIVKESWVHSLLCKSAGREARARFNI